MRERRGGTGGGAGGRAKGSHPYPRNALGFPAKWPENGRGRPRMAGSRLHPYRWGMDTEHTQAANGRATDSGHRAERKAVRKRREEASLKPLQAELLKLQAHLEAEQRRMIILFEGRDAAGKGGTIRRVTRYMNPKHYRVVALGKPTQEQLGQWYFQRYVAQFPTGGEMVLFDRSWYNRAMVEPVFGFCTDEEYRNFMRGVVGFEKDLVRQGTILVKLYFSVTKEEQARRFDRRRDDPLRQWKLSEIDVQAQEHWDELHRNEVRDAQAHEHHPRAVDDRALARQASRPPERDARDPQQRGLRGPRPRDRLRAGPEVVVPAAQEIVLMEAERIRSGRFTE